MNILKRLLLGFLILAGLFITGCGPDTIRGKEYPINDEKTAADDTDLSIDERVQKIVDSMSDEEKVGQMMMPVICLLNTKRETSFYLIAICSHRNKSKS